MHALCQSHSGLRGAVLSDVVVLGSINLDLTSYLDRWPEIGETVTAASTALGLGGKGANQAVAVARLGGSVAMLGAVGRDSFGADVSARLRGEGVDLSLREVEGETTGMAFIDVGPDGGNIIRLSTGSNAHLTAEFVEAHAAVLTGAKVLLLQNEVPLAASLRAAQIARAAGAMVVMDPAPAPVPFWPREVLEAFDVITPNAQEAHLILGDLPQTLDQAEAAARALCDLGPRGAIVTMGGDGVAWCLHGDSGQRPAPRVAAIDTVAAGDCFNGAFASAIARGMAVAEAIRFAGAAGALATTRRGASEAAPTRAEVEAFLR